MKISITVHHVVSLDDKLSGQVASLIDALSPIDTSALEAATGKNTTSTTELENAETSQQ